MAEPELLETLRMHYFKQLPGIKDLAVKYFIKFLRFANHFHHNMETFGPHAEQSCQI